MQKKVFVIGAGVIGLLLARELASRGIDVTVYDSKKKVSDNTAKASGIFSRTGLSRLGIDHKGSFVNHLDGAILHAGGESFKVATKEPVASVLDRGIFAEECAMAAEAAGARIVMGKRLDKKSILDLKADSNNVIVGADGAVSTVASAAGFPGIGEYILTYKAEYQNVSIADIHKVEIFFSNRIAKRFFGWTVPYGANKLEVGIGISNRSRRNSTSAYGAFVETPHMKNMLAGAVKTAGYASLIPLAPRRKTVIGNVLLVGDAAGQVKATTGGGIVFGGACAKVAANAIADHINHGKLLSVYEKEWRKLYGLDLKMHKAVHSTYSAFGERGMAFAFRMIRATGFDKFLGEYGDMDRPSLILKRLIIRNSA